MIIIIFFIIAMLILLQLLEHNIKLYIIAIFTAAIIAINIYPF